MLLRYYITSIVFFSQGQLQFKKKKHLLEKEGM